MSEKDTSKQTFVYEKYQKLLPSVILLGSGVYSYLGNWWGIGGVMANPAEMEKQLKDEFRQKLSACVVEGDTSLLKIEVQVLFGSNTISKLVIEGPDRELGTLKLDIGKLETDAKIHRLQISKITLVGSDPDKLRKADITIGSINLKNCRIESFEAFHSGKIRLLTIYECSVHADLGVSKFSVEQVFSDGSLPVNSANWFKNKAGEAVLVTRAGN